MSDVLYPISLLAIETSQPPAALEARYADRLLTDDIGRLCLDATDARQVVLEHHQRQAARQRRAEQARERTAAYEHPGARVKAIAARQARMASEGRWDPAMTAHAVVLAEDDHAQRAGTPSRRLDHLLRGESYGHTFRGIKED